ncbi:ras GTPase-activating-like protein IQGAP2 [Diaphorina citri]|uniref:Ras GTPase-activating-like protein IQGAP2 n=1 Tax=Diaphorina citri TaxID=121845 RepID=A0A3Q0JAX8_DIACI|nr:ras GTPase-activating-like protein IQGAP2 [Diaphorina citri]
MQSKELQTVRETRDCLLERIAASTEKISYYEKYISSCLQNQTLGKRNVHLTICSNDKHDRKLQHKLIITYTGKQLFEKGILVEAEGLDEKQLKNVLIEFKPRETYGAFQINGKFMGVQMESAEINIQDLLQKKFLGISIMDIFGKAKVNVNLLLHLDHYHVKLEAVKCRQVIFDICIELGQFICLGKAQYLTKMRDICSGEINFNTIDIFENNKEAFIGFDIFYVNFSVSVFFVVSC